MKITERINKKWKDIQSNLKSASLFAEKERERYFIAPVEEAEKRFKTKKVYEILPHNIDEIPSYNIVERDWKLGKLYLEVFNKNVHEDTKFAARYGCGLFNYPSYMLIAKARTSCQSDGDLEIALNYDHKPSGAEEFYCSERFLRISLIHNAHHIEKIMEKMKKSSGTEKVLSKIENSNFCTISTNNTLYNISAGVFVDFSKKNAIKSKYLTKIFDLIYNMRSELEKVRFT